MTWRSGNRLSVVAILMKSSLLPSLFVFPLLCYLPPSARIANGLSGLASDSGSSQTVFVPDSCSNGEMVKCPPPPQTHPTNTKKTTHNKHPKPRIPKVDSTVLGDADQMGKDAETLHPKPSTLTLNSRSAVNLGCGSDGELLLRRLSKPQLCDPALQSNALP